VACARGAQLGEEERVEALLGDREGVIEGCDRLVGRVKPELGLAERDIGERRVGDLVLVTVVLQCAGAGGVGGRLLVPMGVILDERGARRPCPPCPAS
jgi:hypothetical protein